MFTKGFHRHACPGDSITCEVEGFTIIAHIEHDSDTRPDDFDCYSDEDKARWANEDWFFCGVVLSVERAGVALVPHAASLWAVEVNIVAEGNAYLLEVANELLPEALDEARATLDKLCTC